MSAIVLILIIALGFGGVFPQSPSGGVLCGDLDVADCEILENSKETMSSISSMAVVSESAYTINVDGLALTLDATLSGAYSGDLVGLMEMQTNPAANADMLNDSEAMSEYLATYGDFINGITADMDMSIGLPAFLLGPDVPSEINIELIADGGVIYLYAEDFDTGEGEWVGLDLSNFSESYTEIMAEALADMGTEDFPLNDFSGIYDSEYMSLMQNPEFWNNYVEVTRLSDEDLDGQAMAVFIIEYDYAGAFSDERFANALEEYMTAIFAMSGDDMNMDDADFTLDDITSFYTDLMQVLLGSMEMQEVRWVGLEDGYTHHTETIYTLELDMDALAQTIEEFSGEPMDMTDMGFQTLALTMSVMTDMSDFDEALEVEAPEGVELIDPFAEMMSDMDMLDG